MGQSLAAGSSAPIDHFPSSGSFHAGAETVGFAAAGLAGLISSLHVGSSLKMQKIVPLLYPPDGKSSTILFFVEGKYP